MGSVQRSKSAQTPSRQKHMENRLNGGGGRVGSPYGARGNRGSPRINQENRRSKTPQSSSKKQRRQLIERVPTPKELPLVSLSLTSPVNATDIRRSPRPLRVLHTKDSYISTWTEMSIWGRITDVLLFTSTS